MPLPSIDIILSWPTPDYDNPETHGPAGHAIVISLTSLSILILVIRLYTRKHITKGFGLDDILIVIAFFPALGFAISSTIAQFNYGWGTRVWDVPPALFAPGLKMSLVTYNMFNAASCFTKLSILATFYRLLGPSRRRMKIFVRVLAGVIAFQSVLFCIMLFVQCRPLSDFWNIFASPRNCFNEATHLLAAGSINTASDFFVVCLPITTVMGLQLPWRQRAVVIVLFSFGFLACAAGIVRTYITWVMTVDLDMTWHAWSVVVSSATELYIGIICASVPATKPFFVVYLPGKLDPSRRHPSGGSKSSSTGTTDTSDSAASAAAAARRHANKSAPAISCEEEEALRSPTTPPPVLSPHAISMNPLTPRPPPSVYSSSPSSRPSSGGGGGGDPSWRNTWPLPRGDRPVDPRDEEFRNIPSLEEGRPVRDHVWA